MILTCPACTMRYIVSEGAIGPNGRNVRCANCGHQWKADAEEGLDEELFDNAPAFFQEEAEPDTEELAASLEASADALAAELVEDEDETDFSSVLRKEIEQSPIPQGVHPDAEDDPVLAQLLKDKKERDDSAAKKTPAPKAKIGGFLGAALVYVLLLGVIVLLQPQISRLWPASNMFYGMIGLKPSVPGEGLALDGLRAEMKDGRITLSGNILNLKSEDMPVPAVMASIVDENEVVLDRVLIAPPVARLKGEGQASFDVAYPKIPDGASNVTFAFTFVKVAPEKEASKTGDESPAQEESEDHAEGADHGADTPPAHHSGSH